VDVLPGDFYVEHVFDLSVPVDVYKWDAGWLRNWYITTLGNVGQAFASGVNPTDFGTSNELPLVQIIELHINPLPLFDLFTPYACNITTLECFYVQQRPFQRLHVMKTRE